MLAFACAFTMFAGAAFTDQADIEHSDAVDMLNSLGVIGGYPDGSFHPEKTITRAEMAKMIFTIRNGGSTDASAYADVATTFTDIDGHWAAGYIKYCQINGIISGKSSYIFDPEGEVTVVETAKMALVLMGYKADADRANLVGAGWESRVLSLATDNSLLDKVAGSVTAPITRDEAAQLLYNTINADCVLWSNDKEQFIKDGTTTSTSSGTVVNNYLSVGEKYLGLLEWIGTYMGNADVCNLDDGQIRVYGSINGAGRDKNADFVYDFGLSYIGEEVKVLFKDVKGGTTNEPDKKDLIYGVYVTGATKVYNITKNDLQDQKENGTVRFGDKNYDVAAAAAGVEYLNINYGAAKTNGAANKNAVATAFSGLKAVSADTIKFVCNDNGDIVKAYVVEYKLARVTAVNSEKVSINNGVGSLTIADNDIYDGIAKDDIVVVSTYYHATPTNSAAYNIVTKAETVEGKLDGYNGTEKITIDGTVYKIVDTDDDGTGNLATTAVDSDFVAAFTNQIGETVKAYTIDGIVYAAEMVTEATQYAVIEASDGAMGSVFSPLKVKMMKTDGTEVTVEIHKDSVKKKSTDDDTYGIGGAYDTTLEKADLATGNLIKYTNISDTEIKITAMIKVTTAGRNTQVYDKDTKKFNGSVTATDATLFVNKGGDFYAYSIRTLDDITVANTDDYAAMMDGSKVAVAYAELANKPGGASADTVYGIVSSANGTTKVDGDTYTSWTVDLADGSQKTVLIAGDGDTTLAKGDLVAFDVAADDIYSNTEVKVYARVDNNVVDVNVTNAANAFKGFAGEYEDGSILTYYSSKANLLAETSPTTVAVSEDVQVIYVDAADDTIGTDVGVVHDGISSKVNFVAVYEDDDNSKSVIAIFVADDSNMAQ